MMTDYNSLQRRRNLIVGSFVIVAAVAFVWMIHQFRELPIIVSGFRSFNVVVSFPDAPGVQENTPIKYRGYQVGRVVHVMAPEPVTDRKTGQEYHRIKVTLAIENKFKTIPSHVNIKVMKRSMASSYIDLQVDTSKRLSPKDPNRPETAYLVDGMDLFGSTGMSSEFFPPEVEKKLDNLVDSISALADNANKIIGDSDNRANIKTTLANITEATSQATAALESIKKFSDTSTLAMNKTAEQLDDVLSELHSILAKVNTGNSTAARLTNDGRLYENLLDSSEELQTVLGQLKILLEDANRNGIRIKL